MTYSARDRRIVCLYTTGGGTGQMVNNLRDSGLFDRFNVETIITHTPGAVSSRLRIFTRALFRYVSLLFTGRVELVHVHMTYRGSFWRKGSCIALARLCGVPVILHLHGSQFKDFVKESPYWRQRLIRAAFEACHAVVVLSPQWEEYIRNFAPAGRPTVIHNFVDATGLQAAIARVGVTRSPHTLLFLGEIGERKGIFELVKALAKIVPVVPDVRLIAGGGGQVEEVRRLAEQLGIGKHVVLPGWVSGDDKIRLLAEASIYVLPSHNEGLPVSILEAMACGLPVISTPVGGIPEAVRQGREGYLVPPGDVDALAAQLLAVLTDQQLMKQLGEQALSAIGQRFSAQKAVSQMAALYQQAGALPRELPAT